MSTRLQQGFQKTSSAFIDYPIKGLKGDINSDFYEFLTMGIVPLHCEVAQCLCLFLTVSINIWMQILKKPLLNLVKKMALGVVLLRCTKRIYQKPCNKTN